MKNQLYFIFLLFFSFACQENPKRIYTVKSGDTLSEIAQKENTTFNDLMNWNNLKDTNIQVGQKLTIYRPSKEVHKLTLGMSKQEFDRNLKLPPLGGKDSLARIDFYWYGLETTEPDYLFNDSKTNEEFQMGGGENVFLGFHQDTLSMILFCYMDYRVDYTQYLSNLENNFELHKVKVDANNFQKIENCFIGIGTVNDKNAIAEFESFIVEDDMFFPNKIEYQNSYEEIIFIFKDLFLEIWAMITNTKNTLFNIKVVTYGIYLDKPAVKEIFRFGEMTPHERMFKIAGHTFWDFQYKEANQAK